MHCFDVLSTKEGGPDRIKSGTATEQAQRATFLEQMGMNVVEHPLKSF